MERSSVHTKFLLPSARAGWVKSTERDPFHSTDGKWAAYVSDESGEFEIYVRPFLRAGAKIKASVGRAFGPRWSPDGKELFYNSDGKIMAVWVTVEGDNLHVSAPRVHFEIKNPFYSGPHDVSPDGQQFLFTRPAGEFRERSQQTVVVVHWFEELKSKALVAH